MKIFGFVKKLFFVGLTILSDFTNGFFGILVIVSLNAIKLVILLNLQAMKTVSAEKNYFINSLMNIMELLKK